MSVDVVSTAIGGAAQDSADTANTAIGALPLASQYYRGGFAYMLTPQRSGFRGLYDHSGNRNDAEPPLATDPTEAVLNATPGYITFPGHNAQQPFGTNKVKVAPDISRTSVIFSFIINMVALPPSGETHTLFSNMIDNSASNPGMTLTITSSGTLQVAVNEGGVNKASFATSQVVDAGRDHTIGLAFDHKSGDVSIFIDGRIGIYTRAVYNPVNLATAPNQHFFIGGIGRGYNTASYGNFMLGATHLLNFPAGLPLNTAQIMSILHQTPRRLLQDSQILAPANKRVYWCCCGQSNEAGARPTPDFIRYLGCPFTDINTAGSMWPRVGEKAGTRGSWLTVYNNSAVGSTSITHSWCGFLRAWASGMQVLVGSYTLAGGKVYKATKVNNTSNIGAGNFASTVQPVHSSGAVMGADNIEWTYKGAARSQDVDGYIYPPTDAYFDPNGLFARISASVAVSHGYDSKWMMVSIGQQDQTMATTRQQFGTGYIYAAQFALGLGLKVALGFTIYSAVAGADAWQTSNPAATASTDPGTDTAPGVGGMSDAQIFYAGNTNVVKGVNQRYAIGVVPTVDMLGANAQFLPGLNATDKVHGNDPMYDMMSDNWDAWAIANGAW